MNRNDEGESLGSVQTGLRTEGKETGEDMSKSVKIAIEANEKYHNGDICYDEMLRCVQCIGKCRVQKHDDCETCANSAACAKKYGF